MKKRGFSLIALIIIIVLVAGAVFAGFLYYNNKEESKISLQSDEEAVAIPEKCKDFKDNICDLFSCVIENCWCKEGPEPILAETGKEITNSTNAVEAVSKYLESVGSDYVYNLTAVRLNDLFFNVFVYNKNNEEKVLTISFNGKIMETVCGI